MKKSIKKHIALTAIAFALTASAATAVGGGLTVNAENNDVQHEQVLQVAVLMGWLPIFGL